MSLGLLFLLGTGPQSIVETATVGGAGAVTAPDVLAGHETATVAGAGAVAATDNKPQVETATGAGAGAVTAGDVGSFVATATVAGTATVEHDEEEMRAHDTATVAGSGAVVAEDIRADVETATAAGAGALAATDELTAATFDYVETATVTGEGILSASDAIARAELGTAAADGAVTAADVLGCIEAATAFGEAAIEFLEVYTPGGLYFTETASVAGEARIAWGDFLPFYAASEVSGPARVSARAAGAAGSVSGGDAAPTLRSTTTRGTARTEGN